MVGTTLAFVPEWFGRRYFEAPTRTSALATTGTFVAAGLVAACCLGPTLFVLFGVSLAGLSAFGALEPYRPLFFVAGLGFWAWAYQRRRRALTGCEEKVCGTPASRRLSAVLLWASLIALLVAAGYPYAVAHIAG